MSDDVYEVPVWPALPSGSLGRPGVGAGAAPYQAPARALAPAGLSYPLYL